MKPKGVHWGDHPVTPTSSGLGAAPGRLRLCFHRIINPLLLGGETASEESSGLRDVKWPFNLFLFFTRVQRWPCQDSGSSQQVRI